MAPLPRPAELDVRDMLGRGEEPFATIMDAVQALAPGQPLRLLVPFRPLPLIAVMAERGYVAMVRGIGGGDLEILFTPAP